jgi:hypothetical protein
MHMAGGGDAQGGGRGMHVHPVHPPWVRPAGGTSLGGLKQLGLEQNLSNPKFSERADFISK